jgi:hypothetical protein
MWHKPWSACFANVKPCIQTLTPPKKEKKKERKKKYVYFVNELLVS